MIIKYLTCGFGLVKMYLYRIIYGNRLSMGRRIIVYPSVRLQIEREARIILGHNVSIRRNCEINARENGIIHIGNNTFLNTGCMITAHKSIVIGDNVEFGPNVLVFDHDHKFKEGYEARAFDCEDIEIGNNVWIGAGTIILRGTKIGDNSVIAAGSVLKGIIPRDSVIIQKRVTEIRSIAK